MVIPMLDIHTIGAGGGSIARVDSAGGLHVGPISAGASPGPACYDRGGDEPTITDANVVLGRLPVLEHWTGGLKLNHKAASTAVNKIAQQMGCTVEEAARGIIDLANEHMAQALRVISIHRGYDPADFSLFPFGGAGGMHMCEVAQLLGMNRIIVPMHAGILSAQGMLQAPVGQMASQSICRLWQDCSEEMLEQLFETLLGKATEIFSEHGLKVSRHALWLDLRYQGQSSTISIEFSPHANVLDEFQAIHYQRFKFNLAVETVELVTVRIWIYQDTQKPASALLEEKTNGPPLGKHKLAGIDGDVQLFDRSHLASGQKITGPAIIFEASSTHYIAQDWQAEVDRFGHIHLQLRSDCH